MIDPLLRDHRGYAVSCRLLDEERAQRQAWELKAGAVEIAAALDWTHVGPSHRELMRRRYPPTGDPDVWVRYGPAAWRGEVAA